MKTGSVWFLCSDECEAHGENSTAPHSQLACTSYSPCVNSVSCEESCSPSGEIKKDGDARSQPEVHWISICVDFKKKMSPGKMIWKHDSRLLCYIISLLAIILLTRSLTTALIEIHTMQNRERHVPHALTGNSWGEDVTSQRACDNFAQRSPLFHYSIKNW